MSPLTFDAKARMLHRDLTDRALGAFFAVHWELGSGFLEEVYARALAIALADSGLTFAREAPVPIHFRGRRIASFRADFLVEGALLIELKAVRELERGHTAQLLNYLRGTDIEVGLLLNFGLRPTFRRLAFDNARKRIPRSSAYLRGQSVESSGPRTADR